MWNFKNLNITHTKPSGYIPVLSKGCKKETHILKGDTGVLNKETSSDFFGELTASGLPVICPWSYFMIYLKSQLVVTKNPKLLLVKGLGGALTWTRTRDLLINSQPL